MENHEETIQDEDELDFSALVEQETNFITFYCNKFNHSALKVVKAIIYRLENEGT